jgi:uncharacterized protein with PIN domain
MYRVTFRFYAELNDFLTPDYQQQAAITLDVKDRASVKDAVEALGVPHPEIDLLLVNGNSVEFSYILRDGDRVSVYPCFHSIDIAALTNVRPPPLAQPRFVADIHLGKLARYLRMLGFDVLYPNNWEDKDLARLASTEGRILLTRDRGLLKRSEIVYGYCVRSMDVESQLWEVLYRFNAFDSIAPFQRCPRCNGLTLPVPKAEICDGLWPVGDHRLPPLVQHHYDDFRRCSNCNQIYWKGTHYERIQQVYNRVMQHPTYRTKTLKRFPEKEFQ